MRGMELINFVWQWLFALLRATSNIFLSIWIHKSKKKPIQKKILQILSHCVVIKDAGTGLIKKIIFMRPGPAFSKIK